MASITLCMLNSQYIHAAPAPWCLKKGIEAYSKQTHTVQIAEGTVNEAPTAVLWRLTAQIPDAYGFCCYIWNITRVLELIPSLRQTCPDAKILLGGPEAAHRATELLQTGAADGVFCGEGEMPLAMLMDRLDEAPMPDDIPGLWTVRNGEVWGNGFYYSRELPPPPDDDAYINALHGRIAYIETSRGCPFSCAFCLSGRQEPLRFRPVEESVARLVKLANSGTRTIKLVDRTFNCNPKRTYDIIDRLINLRGTAFPADVCFHFEVGADLFDERTMQRLSEAPVGLFQLEAGIQSFHPETLAAVSRKTDTSHLYDVLRRLIAMGNMHVHVDLIAGLPYEDEARFGASFDRAYSLQPHMLQFGFLKLLHGSRLRTQQTEFGFAAQETPPYQIQRTNWLSTAELDGMKATEDALDRMYNCGRFRRTAAYAMKAANLGAYAFYKTVGTMMHYAPDIDLDGYTAKLFDALQQLPGVEKTALRDELVKDRLATVRGGKLPAALRVTDERFGLLTRTARTALQIPAAYYGGAVLYHGGVRVLAADYRYKDPVTGQYRLTEQHV